MQKNNGEYKKKINDENHKQQQQLIRQDLFMYGAGPRDGNSFERMAEMDCRQTEDKDYL